MSNIYEKPFFAFLCNDRSEASRAVHEANSVENNRNIIIEII